MILVFLSGLAVMVLEMSFSRLMAPYFGASLITWTNLIAVVMLGLSIGYAWGGRLADRGKPERTLEIALSASALWLLILPFLSPFVFARMADMPWPLQWWVSAGSFLSLLILIFPPMVGLGMTLPLALKWKTEHFSQLGRRSGFLSMLSTWGSFVGTFLPAFLLLPYFGVTDSFIGMGLVLGVATALSFRRFWVVVIWVVVGFALLAWPQRLPAGVLEHRESAYGALWMRENSHGERGLYVDTPFGIQSVYNPATPLNEYYYAYIGVIPPLIAEPKKVLILGHAGGSFTRVLNAYYPDLQVTGVEIDPAVTQMAKDYMDFSDLKVTMADADARAFLLKDAATYDLIVLDTYHAASLPAHLATQEFFDLTHSHLNNGGLMVVNAASDDGPFLESLSATLATLPAPLHTFHVPNTFNTLLISGEIPELQPANYDEDLQELAANFESGVSLWSGSAEPFTDEKMGRVDTLAAQMWWRILSE